MRTDAPAQPGPHDIGDGPPRSGDSAALHQRIADLGAETRAERLTKLVVPWLFTIGLHAGVLMLGTLVTWSVVILTADRDRPPISADFNAMTFDPVAIIDLAPIAAPEQVVAASSLDVASELTDDPFDIDVEVTNLMPESLAGGLPVDFAPPPAQGSASFLGISTTNARQIVYIVDASGGMIPYLPIVLKELARSLDALTEQQSFSVLFFQRSESIQVPPERRLIPATTRERARVLKWIEENVIPRGTSNPLAAFEVALRMNPDVIFLLSDNITGAGIYEIDQHDLLERLDVLNPRDRLTGRRRTQINCIQFLDPDPLDTLRKIAEAHGGPNGYKYLSRGELGLAIR